MVSYHFQEGSITRPDGWKDQSMTVFRFAGSDKAGSRDAALVITRDNDAGDDLTGYVNRQHEAFRKRWRCMPKSYSLTCSHSKLCRINSACSPMRHMQHAIFRVTKLANGSGCFLPAMARLLRRMLAGLPCAQAHLVAYTRYVRARTSLAYSVSRRLVSAQCGRDLGGPAR